MGHFASDRQSANRIKAPRAKLLLIGMPSAGNFGGEMNEKCQWKRDEWHGYFDTSCKQAFCFENEYGPRKNKFRFCPYCG